MKIWKSLKYIWQILSQFSNISATLGRAGHAFFHVCLAVSTEIIQQQILQTENDLKTWCNKKSRETGTTKKMKSYVMDDCRLVCLSMGKFVFIIFRVSRLAESFCSMCYFKLYINIMLGLFSIQYSKTECTVRSLASSLDCRSQVQGVHHTIVAVELWLQLLLKKLRLAIHALL